MRTWSTPGFDLRDAVGDAVGNAVDSLRETLRPRGAAPTGSGHGDIRSAILVELSDEPMHGYQLIQAIEARTVGAWTPSAGTVYPTLQLLADEGLVTAAQVGERKVYTLTDAGRLAAADVAHPTEPSDAGRGRNAESALTLAKASAKLAQAITLFPHSGSREQSERAAAIVDEARKKLYAILAED